MAMTVSLHAKNNPEQFRTEGYIAKNYDTYAVVTITLGDGDNMEDVTLFFSEEQLNQLKSQLQKTSVEFKKHNASKEVTS